MLKLPTDYGVFCLAVALLGAHTLFVGEYMAPAVATAGYTLLAVGNGAATSSPPRSPPRRRR